MPSEKYHNVLPYKTSQKQYRGSVIKELIKSWLETVDPGKKKVSLCVTSEYPAWACLHWLQLGVQIIILQHQRLSSSSWDVYLLPSPWSHPAKKNNSVFSPPQSPMLAYHTAKMVNIPEFIASAAIKHPRSEESYVNCVAEKLKSFSSITTLSEEKRKLPRVWVQLCFQMCQGSGVKDKSTRMWRTPTRNRFAVCAFLTGGGRWAECLVFLLSATPSERPHFAVVNYDTATFVLATLAMFTSGTGTKCQAC